MGHDNLGGVEVPGVWVQDGEPMCPCWIEARQGKVCCLELRFWSGGVRVVLHKAFKVDA